MFKLDNALLEELGLGALPAEEKNRMLAHIYETLEMRVGWLEMTAQELDSRSRQLEPDQQVGIQSTRVECRELGGSRFDILVLNQRQCEVQVAICHVAPVAASNIRREHLPQRG